MQVKKLNLFSNISKLDIFNKCGILLEGSSVTATSASLGVSDNSALELARTINV